MPNIINGEATVPASVEISPSTHPLYMPTSAVTANGTGNNAIWHTWSSQNVMAPTGGTVRFSTETASTVFIDTWQQWNSPAITASNTTSGRITLDAHLPPSRERLRELAAQTRRRCRETERAFRKAETTLLGLLAREQRITWHNHRFFDFKVGARTYRIEEGREGNVYLLDDNLDPMVRLCCHPEMHVPLPDVALAQWMMLRYDEASFLRMANIHWARGGYYENQRVMPQIAA